MAVSCSRSRHRKLSTRRLLLPCRVDAICAELTVAPPHKSSLAANSLLSTRAWYMRKTSVILSKSFCDETHGALLFSNANIPVYTKLTCCSNHRPAAGSEKILARSCRRSRRILVSSSRSDTVGGGSGLNSFPAQTPLISRACFRCDAMAARFAATDDLLTLRAMARSSLSADSLPPRKRELRASSICCECCSMCCHAVAAPMSSRNEANAGPSRSVVLLLKMSVWGLNGPGVDGPRDKDARPRSVSCRRLERVCIGDSAIATLMSCSLGMLDGVLDAVRASVLTCLLLPSLLLPSPASSCAAACGEMPKCAIESTVVRGERGVFRGECLAS